MKEKINKNIIISLLILFSVLVVPLLANAFSFEYAKQDNYSYYDEAGFFSGIWHGLIAPYSLLVRLATDVEMYAITNTGWFYDAGFLIGVVGSIPIGWIAAIIALIALFV